MAKAANTNTFIVSILYQQGASWQGTIRWTNQRKEQHFRSELELLTLISEALTSGNAGEVSKEV
ncbi:MAG: hypothetical protein GXX99_00975 [Clostridiales bacterium]|nr:hypothetical protein [Clostridiales bacterium]